MANSSTRQPTKPRIKLKLDKNKCCYINCVNRKDDEHRIFYFPKNIQRQNIWIEYTGNAVLRTIPSSSLTKRGICADHFTNDNISPSGRLHHNSNPIPWDYQEKYQKLLTSDILKKTTSVASGKLRNEDCSVNDKSKTFESHEKETTVENCRQLSIDNESNNDICVNEVNSFETHNENATVKGLINKNHDENLIMSKLPEKTYPSGKEIFGIFQTEDSCMEYLNEEPEFQTNSSHSQTLNSNSNQNCDKQSFFNSDHEVSSKSLNIVELDKENLKLNKKIKTLRKLLRESDKIKQENSKLKKKIKSLKSDKKNNGAKFSRLTEKYKNLLQEMNIDKYLDRNKCNNALSRTMIKLQLHKKKTAYTDDEKILSKLIFYHSASCYSRLRQAGLNLPAESTVRSWVAEISVEPGFSDDLLKLIKEALSKFPESERLCALKWDEMSTKAWEEYSKKYDMIEGIVDLGFLGRRPEVSKQVLILCLDSINVKNRWRQLFAYFFTGKGATGEELKRIVTKALELAKDAGALVKLVACDQGASNRKAFELFNVQSNEPHFEINKSKYFASFDWPHLIKRLIYQLRTYKKIYYKENVIVNFEDFSEAYRIDSFSTTSNLLGHLTEAHFNPNAFEAMNVKRAFQLLSLRMSASIKTAGSKGELKSQTWQASAEFAESMNAVIDACNSQYEVSKNLLKRPMADRNLKIIECLEKFRNYVREWRIFKKGKYVSPPCFKGMELTVGAFLSMYQEIKLDVTDFILATRLCNTDSVEHTISKLRAKGGFNRNPTARLIRLSIRHIVSTTFINTSSKANVNCDEAPSLVQINKKSILEAEITDKEKNDALEEISKKVDEINEEYILEDISRYFDEDEPFFPRIEDKGHYERNAITYFAGHIARQSLKRLPCDRCEKIFIRNAKDKTDDDEMYTAYREYEHHDEEAPTISHLIRPTEAFKKIIVVQLESFSKNYERLWHETQLLDALVECAEADTRKFYPNWFDENNDSCYDHKIEALRYLFRVKIYAQTGKHNKEYKKTAMKTVKSNNRKLKNIKNV